MSNLPNLLQDALPPKVRKYAYLVAAVASVLAAAWTASQGDWNVFIGSVLSTFVNALAASNTPSNPPALENNLK